MKTLLEQARQKQKEQKNGQRTITVEHAKLACAYLSGEVTLRSIANVLGYSKDSTIGMGVYITMARSLRLAYELGYIKIND